jgi:hypothetical protein
MNMQIMHLLLVIKQMCLCHVFSLKKIPIQITVYNGIFSLHFSCCILCVDIFCRVQFIAESLSTRGFFLLLCILQEENCCIPEPEFSNSLWGLGTE